MTNAREKLIVVTGCTRGLGRAMTKELIALGHTILGCGRSVELIEELRRVYGAPHRFTRVDVSDDDEVQAWAESLVASRGAPDLLLNNAGVVNRKAPLWEVSMEEFNQVIDTNVKGVRNVLRHWLPGMLARRTGVVVNFSSGFGRSASPQVAPYCASKWAIEGMTRALALELPKGMAAVSLDPGVIDTEILRSFLGDQACQYMTAEAWATKVMPSLLELGPEDNGMALTAPLA